MAPSLLFVFPPGALVEGNPSAGCWQPCSRTLVIHADETSVWAQSQLHSLSLRQWSTVVRTGFGLPGTQVPPLCGLGQWLNLRASVFSSVKWGY